MTHKDIFSSNSPDLLRNLSSQDFLNFGVQDMAYIKKTKTDDETKYIIHAADGTPLSVMESYDSAMGVIQHNDLEPITVQ